MSYQALYRAWRPDGFSTIVGQAPITTTLVNQIKTGRIAHAYLFCGSRGTGKTSTAKVFARAINCLSPLENGDPCGVCEACLALQHENNMDVIEIDAASNNGVDEIRELRDKIKYPPSVGRYKVYIVDEVHMLSTGAFNALLKTLEEPPSHAVFILATTEPQKLPATILSRCQRYDFKRLLAQDIIGKLQKELAAMDRTASDEALYEIARAAEGGMRDAESLMDMCLAYSEGEITAGLVHDVLGSTDRAGLFKLAGALLQNDAATALKLIDTQMREGRDAQVLARELSSHMRALLLARLMPNDLAELMDITPEDAKRYIDQAQSSSEEKLTRIMELFAKIETEMRWANRPQTALELSAVKACAPEREQSIEALLERVAQLEDKLKHGVAIAAPSDIPPPPDAPPPDDDAPPFDLPTAPKKQPAAQPKPDKPKPVEPSAPPPEWAQVLEALKAASPGLVTPLGKADQIWIEDDAVHIGFLKKYNMFMQIVKQDQKIAQIEQSLSSVFNRPMRAVIKEVQPGAAAKSAPAPAKNAIEQVYEVFGREHVLVVDEL